MLNGDMMELADIGDLESPAESVQVQVLLSPPRYDLVVYGCIKKDRCSIPGKVSTFAFDF